MEKKTKDFTNKKALLKYIAEHSGDKLDELIVIAVRLNVLRELYDDRIDTDEFWGRHLKKRDAWEKIWVKEIEKLKIELQRVKKERENWKIIAKRQVVKG